MALSPQSFALFKENLLKLNISEHAKPLMFQAINKPNTLSEKDWIKVVEEISEKAAANTKHGRTAAKVCDSIAKCEYALTSDSQEKHFRKVLLSHLQGMFKHHKLQQYKNRTAWIGFVGFLCAIFDIMQINNMPLMTLVLPVYEVLGILADPEFASEDAAVQCLVVQMQFIGEELDRLNKGKMNELIEKLRTLLCSETLSQVSCLMVLEILELRSGQWKLSPAAYQYYYEETVPA